MIYDIECLISKIKLEELFNYLQDCVFFSLIAAYNKVIYLFILKFITTNYNFVFHKTIVKKLYFLIDSYYSHHQDSELWSSTCT